MKSKRIRGVIISVEAAHQRIIEDIIVIEVTAGSVGARSLIKDTDTIAQSVTISADMIDTIGMKKAEKTTKVIIQVGVDIAEALQKTQEID